MSAGPTFGTRFRRVVGGKPTEEFAGRDRTTRPAPDAAPPAARVTPESIADTECPGMSTVDLVARVRGGDQDALEAVCLRCLKGLHRFAAGRVPPRIRGMLETQDLVAEALHKGLAKLHDLDLGREGSLMAYLRQVLRNLIVDKIRAADRAPTPASLDERHADDTLSPLERALDREKVELYEAALQRLKPRDAELIMLRMEQQASYGEIAVFVGLPTANAARVAVRRALLRLALEMSRAGTGGGPPREGESS